MFYDTLIARRGLCPEGCSECLQACAGEHDGLALLHAAASQVNICRQCSVPACADACPSEAIVKNPKGIVEVDGDLCTGCGLCVDACTHEVMFLDRNKDVAVKCDLCNGDPKCVKACPHGRLSVGQGSKVYELLAKEEYLSPGMPACAGCPVELAVRFTLRVLGKNAIVFSGPGCCPLPGRSYLATYGCLMTNVASSMTGMKRYLEKIGNDALCVAFVGDGLTADVGFQPLSGAAERGENLIYICYDNEAYMNTGIQRSSTTPFSAWTTTTPVGPAARGKKQVSKNLPLIMMAHGIPYVATASTGHLDDYGRKLLKAKELSREGLAYIHLFTPCPTGWRFDIDQGMEICRKAVETNYFPLWEAVNGDLRLTNKVANPKPVSDFTAAQGRFKHLDKKELEELQSMVEVRFAHLEKMASGN